MESMQHFSIVSAHTIVGQPHGQFMPFLHVNDDQEPSHATVGTEEETLV